MGQQAEVLDATGRRLSPTSLTKARRLVAAGRAALVYEDPLTVQLPRPVDVPPPPAEELPVGKRLLLHVCCAPCATYTVGRLRDEGFAIEALWYNPNIAPAGEHELRRASLERFAGLMGLPVQWMPDYPIQDYERAIINCPDRPGRCEACYRLRLGWTAQVARAGDFDAFTTTLLISPYQDQDLLHGVGREMGQEHGVDFYFENFRRGWAERGRLTRKYGLYRQRYCGCTYSLLERQT
jgi:predicted adenine nucleotide alpha hydrolase (AANH) superfamily ATPase